MTPLDEPVAVLVGLRNGVPPEVLRGSGEGRARALATYMARQHIDLLARLRGLDVEVDPLEMLALWTVRGSEQTMQRLRSVQSPLAGSQFVIADDEVLFANAG